MFNTKGLISTIAAVLFSGASCAIIESEDDLIPEETAIGEETVFQEGEQVYVEPTQEETNEENCPKVTPSQFESMVNTLYTEEAKANTVREYIDKVGFGGWVVATGGSHHFKCLSDGVPVSDELIMETIDYYRNNKIYDVAGELAKDAGYAKQDGKFFDVAKDVFFQGANDKSLNDRKRADLYHETARFEKRYSEERVNLVEQSIGLFVEA